jgi:hypothetical protein
MGILLVSSAGASYGSDSQNTPRLGAGLFDELRRFNPNGWGTIAGSLAYQFRRDFEEAMKSVAPQALTPLQRGMAAYFFEFKPSTSSLYFHLGRWIARKIGWSGAAYTLNYERLLESSLLAAGIQPFVGQPPAGQTGVELYSPHGCCHIFCDTAKGTAGAVSFDGFAVSTDGTVTVVWDPEQHRPRLLQDDFSPGMSYFEPQKRITAGHSFIERKRARWREIAASATTVVIVGVRVRPHDDLVWGPIAATGERLVYCGGASGAYEFFAWAATTRAGRSDRVLAGYIRDEIT